MLPDNPDIIQQLVMARSGRLPADMLEAILVRAFDEIIDLRKQLKAIQIIDPSERERKARVEFDAATRAYYAAEGRRESAHAEYRAAKEAHRLAIEREVEGRDTAATGLPREERPDR